MTAVIIAFAALAALGTLSSRPAATPAPVDGQLLLRRHPPRERFWSALDRLDLPPA